MRRAPSVLMLQLVVLLSTLQPVWGTGSRWQLVENILKAYFPMRDMSFSAGDTTGRKFTFQKGDTNMSSMLAMASSSKFPAATAIMGVVAERHLSLDTHAYEVFSWWTSDSNDRRSRVTMRNLLSFTSGFYSHDTGGDVPCLTGENASMYTTEACAREIYEQAPFEFEPGSMWAYHSFHLQIAGAMAAAAARMPMQALLHKYLIGRLNLTGTFWSGGENPELAGSMVTTGDDYDKILGAYLSYKIVPKDLADEMERDYLEPPVKIANSSVFLTQLLGHYSMCNYFECFVPKAAVFTPRCKEANIHMDAGLFGYYPLFDRAKGTYMQIVYMKLVSSGTDFQPTIAAMALRRLIKPVVDWALLRTPHESAAAQEAVKIDLSRKAIWDVTDSILEESGLKEKYPSPASIWNFLVDAEAEQVVV